MILETFSRNGILNAREVKSIIIFQPDTIVINWKPMHVVQRFHWAPKVTRIKNATDRGGRMDALTFSIMHASEMGW